MPERLAEALRDRIRRDGPLPFPAWMEACLYDPRDGFYTRGGVTGPDAGRHFATGPTLHPFLGAAVADEAVAAWRRMGGPEPLEVVEWGGGEGGLARAALAHLDATQPRLARGVRWRHVERSPAHRARQAGGDPRVGPDEAGGDLAGRRVVVVANEFLDALPFEWLQRDAGGWRRVCVDVDAAGGFREALRPLGERELAAWGGDLPDIPLGTRCAFMPEAPAWFEGLARADQVAAVVVDYGEPGRRLWDGSRPDGTVRGYRGQAFASVLDAPGDVDITASVDFSAMRRWAERAGLSEASFETQEAFLLRHGILEALNRTDRSTREGASSYLRLRQLLLPTGMGAAFKVARYERP